MDAAPRWIVATLSCALGSLSAGCACGYDTGFFPSQACSVQQRASKVLECPNVIGSRRWRSETTLRSGTDTDTYTIYCTHGARECVHYACPKGRPSSACYRE